MTNRKYEREKQICYQKKHKICYNTIKPKKQAMEVQKKDGRILLYN